MNRHDTEMNEQLIILLSRSCRSYLLTKGLNLASQREFIGHHGTHHAADLGEKSVELAHIRLVGLRRGSREFGIGFSGGSGRFPIGGYDTDA